jgi:hypothetical protein
MFTLLIQTMVLTNHSFWPLQSPKWTALLATVVGGEVTPLITKSGILTRYSRWIFIIEGVVTAAIGVLSKFWLTDWPETASFLNDEERALLIARLNADTGDAVMNRFDKRAAKRIFSDPKIYLGTAAYFGKDMLASIYSSSANPISF